MAQSWAAQSWAAQSWAAQSWAAQGGSPIGSSYAPPAHLLADHTGSLVSHDGSFAQRLAGANRITGSPSSVSSEYSSSSALGSDSWGPAGAAGAAAGNPGVAATPSGRVPGSGQGDPRKAHRSSSGQPRLGLRGSASGPSNSSGDVDGDGDLEVGASARRGKHLPGPASPLLGAAASSPGASDSSIALGGDASSPGVAIAARDDATAALLSANSRGGGSVTIRQRVYAVFPLIKWHAVLLSLVYFFEYVASVGFAAKSNPTKGGHGFFEKNAYEILAFCYQLGVLISRSSVSFIEIQRLDLLCVVQGGMFFLWLFQALYRFMPLAAQFIIMVVVGLIGGAMYVNTFVSILRDRKLDAERELATNIVSFFINIGIMVSAFFTLLADSTFLHGKAD